MLSKRFNIFGLSLLLLVQNCWADENRPNIVLCMGDDHGWEETGYHGHTFLKTPVLDEMAARGLSLEHFYSGHPSCSPTRGSVLTGRHPNRYGTFTPGCSIRPEEITIAHILSKAGYRCGHFGKWHLGPVKAASPTNPKAMGFDHYVSHDNFFELNPVFSRNGAPPEQFSGESSQLVVDETIRFIDDCRLNDKPFLAVVWFGSPHEPYSGLPEDLELYDDLPQEYQKKTVSLTSNETGLRVKRSLRDVLRERFAEITAMDRAIGNLRNHLREKSLQENTVVWYCGDNGTPPSGLASSPFRGLKGQVYEGGIRVPCVIEWPAKIQPGNTRDMVTVTSDILPTLCDITKQKTPDRPLDGISLLPLLEGKMTIRPSPVFFWMFDSKGERKEYKTPYIDPELQKGTTPLVKLSGGIATRNFINTRHPKILDSDFAGDRAILHDDFKLIVKGPQGDQAKKELFHLKSDPAEKQNHIKEDSKTARSMEEQLHSWQQSVLESLTGADY